MAKDQIKKSWELLHPKPEGDTELAKIVANIKRREGKSGKQLVAEALEARHPTQDKGNNESANVKLAKQKKEQGIPLTPKDRIVLGFEYLHGEVEKPVEVEDDKN